jgi:predicted alpha-1,2-mannosidase
MKRTIIALLLLAASFIVFAQKRIIDYVNPFIGTGGHGHTYPGATVPFGMVQISPDNGTQGWDWCSGYNYSDSVIQGFSHTHLSGTGIGDLCDISVMPMVDLYPDTLPVKCWFSHKDEKASPGYYSVFLSNLNIKAEFTAGTYSAYHKYTFPESTNASISIDLGFALNWDRPTDCYIEQINDTLIVGHRFSKGWADNQKVFFAAILSKPVKNIGIFQDRKPVGVGVRNAKGKDVKAFLQFTTTRNEIVLMKVGISFANLDGAYRSLQEISNRSFADVRKSAEVAWEKELRRVQINTRDERLKEIFYTALYHTYLAPTIFNDANGKYKGTDGLVYTSGRKVYSAQSLWDTFRAANPLFTLTQPERVGDIIYSFLLFYDQYGYLPVWDLHFNETNTMTGYHAVPIIADAILKGIKGFDYNKAYEAMKKSSMQDIRGTNFYRQYQYIPYDKNGESVTITLEYAFDDWCIAQVAKKLDKDSDYNYYMQRAGYYANLFDKGSGFFRGKNSHGEWLTPFDPFEAHYGTFQPYTEGNAWQHSFFVPHDIKGLWTLHGSKTRLISKLDSLFTISSKLTGNAPPDITGLIGQYAHGNEPSHHIAYMYDYLGEPWKTQEIVRKIMTELYSYKPDGLCGNEDCGQMSAWYVFGVMGFYPQNPASGEYAFGSPMMDDAAIALPGGKVFLISVKNNSTRNKYIRSIKLNGRNYTKMFITHADIMKGGLLEFEMSDQPNKNLGTNESDLPYSMTK